MNRNYLWTLLCLFTFMLVACNKEQNLTENVPDEDELIIEPPTEIFFTYQGKEYYSKLQAVDEELFIVDDQIRAFHEELFENPNLAILVVDKGKYAYYNSYQEIQEILMSEDESLQTQANNLPQIMHVTQCQLWLNYDIKQKKGLPIGDLIITRNKPYLYMKKMPGDTDKALSSLHMRAWYGGPSSPSLRGQCCYTTLFTEQDFKGYSITFYLEAPYRDSKVDHLGHYQVQVLPPRLPVGDWNDKMRSFIFGLYGVPVYI